MKTLVKNAKAIVTCNETDEVLWGCDMLIEDQEIVKMEKGIDGEADLVIDASDSFIYPGLVNTHHHFFQTFVRNTIKVDYCNMTVPEWLGKIYPVFQKIDNEVIYYSSLAAMGDLLKHGCTTAFDHQYLYSVASGKENVDRQMEAAQLLNIRYHAGRGTNTLPRSEGSTMPDNMLESTEEFLEDCQRLIDRFHDPNRFSKRQIVVAPCQPMNCYKETFVESLKLARENQVFLHTHLGEGENQIMEQRYGMRSIDWCEEIGFYGPDVFFAHGWEFTNDELDKLGEWGSGISHCPAPAVLGGFPIINMNEMRKRKVLVSLGCDGSATNDSSSLLDTMRMAFIMQSFYSKERGGSVTPYEILKMATINGAKTLGREDIGSLEIGKAGDFFSIDTTKLEMTGLLHDPKNMIARGGVVGPTQMTVVGGEIVSKEGRLVNVDEKELNKKGEEVCTRVLRNTTHAF